MPLCHPIALLLIAISSRRPAPAALVHKFPLDMIRQLADIGAFRNIMKEKQPYAKETRASLQGAEDGRAVSKGGSPPHPARRPFSTLAAPTARSRGHSDHVCPGRSSCSTEIVR
jgi:hypothetical protein